MSHGTEAEDPRRWLALAIIAIAQLMVVLDATIVNIALPSAQKALHISLLNRQWVITADTLAFGGLLLLGGGIADYAGRKRVFVIGLLGFAGASALGGLAQNAAMLFAARSLQGAFGALMAPAALSLITVTFHEPKERAKAFGVYGAIAGGGAAIGLIMGGLLTQYASWRWCLLVNVPVAILAAVSGSMIVRESKAHGETHYDIPGALVATAGLASLVYGFTKADQDGWSSTTTMGFLALAAILLVGFVLFETKTKNPLLPMRVLLERNRGGSFLGSFMAGLGLFGMFLFLTYYLQGTLHYSALKSGFAFLPFSFGIVVSATIASKLLPKLGPRPLMSAGFLSAGLGLIWLTKIGVDTSYFVHGFPSELVMSFGLGFAFVSLSSTALVGVSPHDAGVASAMVNTTQQVGGSLGTALLNTLAASATRSSSAGHVGEHLLPQQALVHGYTVAFWVSAGAVLAAALASVVLVRASKDTVPAQSGEMVMA